jgi:hypothetical protein
MSLQEKFVQDFERLLVQYQQALSTDDDQALPKTSRFPENPSQTERKRLVSAARLALLDLESREQGDSAKWYARPGEADWGC